MNTTSIGNWLVDLRELTCCNTENKIIIVFEKRGTALEGKIKYIPIELLERWAEEPDGDSRIRKTLFEADEIFFRAYFNHEIEGKYIAAL